MKVLRELPREFVSIAPRTIDKRGPPQNKDTAFYMIKELLIGNPEGVYEVDCQPSNPEKHPKQCKTQVDMSRINAIGILPRRLVGYHTKKDTFVFWMVSEQEEGVS